MSNGPDQPAIAPGIAESFEAVVLPHLDAAHRLARWLMRDADVAEDVVQEASLRALRYFRTFVGGDGRAWFLRIVRNTCYAWRQRHQPPTDSFDEEQHSGAQPQFDPETLLLQVDDANVIRRALSRLPDHFHQLLVLREFEGLSYRQLAEVTGVPIGTVMSRLSRAREALRGVLDTRTTQPGMSSAPTDAGMPSGIVGSRRMNDQLERTAGAEPNRREVTDVTCGQATNVERLGEGDDRTVDSTDVVDLIDGLAEQLVVRGALDEIIDECAGVANQRCCATGGH